MFRIETLGCKVNQYESQAIRERFEAEGFAEVAPGKQAAVAIVNLCTVTATADSKGRKLIRRIAREDADTRIIVTGCMTEESREKLRALPGVWHVAPNSEKLGIARMAKTALLADSAIGEESASRSLATCSVSGFSGHSRAFVKVQDGCSMDCSYCIVPHVRGTPVSKPFDTAVEEIRRLARAGFREIVICGIHVGSYGVDLDPPRSLTDLLVELEKHDVRARLRLSSIELGELDEGLLNFLVSSQRVCPHLHVPLQSGSDRILRAMNRRYTAGEYVARIGDLRARLDTPAITTDVIVGFPGEERSDFERTMAVCEACEFSKIHIFPFSPRRGTPAAAFRGRCDAGETRRHVAELRELERKLASSFRARLVGRELRVLVETGTPGRDAGASRPEGNSQGGENLVMAGFCERYIRTRFVGGEADVGGLVTVTCLKSVAGALQAVRADIGNHKFQIPNSK